MQLFTPIPVETYSDYYSSPVDNIVITSMNAKQQKTKLGIEPVSTDVRLIPKDSPDRPYGSPTDYLLPDVVTPVPRTADIIATDKGATDSPRYPIDADIINNPSTEGLFTLHLPGSPLINNLQDQPASLSGSDPLPNPQFTVNDPGAEQTTTDGTDPDCLIPGAVSGCYLRKSVAKETGIFIVGALILMVGIYALTR